MDKSNLKNLINEARRQQNSKAIALLTFVLGEYELQEAKNKNITLDQVIRKTIENNLICLKARANENLEEENQILSSLLPSYLDVPELKNHLSHLKLDSSGKSMGEAIKYLRSNGLSFRNEDLKDALKN